MQSILVWCTLARKLHPTKANFFRINNNYRPLRFHIYHNVDRNLRIIGSTYQGLLRLGILCSTHRCIYTFCFSRHCRTDKLRLSLHKLHMEKCIYHKYNFWDQLNSKSIPWDNLVYSFLWSPIQFPPFTKKLTRIYLSLSNHIWCS